MKERWEKKAKQSEDKLVVKVVHPDEQTSLCECVTFRIVSDIDCWTRSYRNKAAVKTFHDV